MTLEFSKAVLTVEKQDPGPDAGMMHIKFSRIFLKPQCRQKTKAISHRYCKFDFFSLELCFLRKALKDFAT